MDYREKIFDMLDIKPNEVFKIKQHCGEYRLTEDLMLEYNFGEEDKENWMPFSLKNDLRFLLNGKYTIVKLSKLTEEEQLAIKYARAGGFKYLVKDKFGFVAAYETKPIRGGSHWFKENSKVRAVEIALPISFIKWEDEPYYIGN